MLCIFIQWRYFFLFYLSNKIGWDIGRRNWRHPRVRRRRDISFGCRGRYVRSNGVCVFFSYCALQPTDKPTRYYMGAHLISIFSQGAYHHLFPASFLLPHCSEDDEKLERNGKWFSGVINFLIVQPAPVSIFIPSYTSYHIYPFFFVVVCVLSFLIRFGFCDDGFWFLLFLSASENEMLLNWDLVLILIHHTRVTQSIPPLER